MRSHSNFFRHITLLLHIVAAGISLSGCGGQGTSSSSSSSQNALCYVGSDVGWETSSADTAYADFVGVKDTSGKTSQNNIPLSPEGNFQVALPLGEQTVVVTYNAKVANNTCTFFLTYVGDSDEPNSHVLPGQSAFADIKFQENVKAGTNTFTYKVLVTRSGIYNMMFTAIKGMYGDSRLTITIDDNGYVTGKDGNTTISGFVSSQENPGGYVIYWNAGNDTFAGTIDPATHQLTGSWSNGNVLSTRRVYSVSGKATLSSGLGIPNVTVSATTDAGNVVTCLTDATGSYTLPLQNGRYTLTASLAGYTFNPSSIALNVNGANVVNQDFADTSPAAWSRVVTTGVSSDTYPKSVVIDPTNSEILYITGIGDSSATGIYKSANGGKDWNYLSGFNSYSNALVIDPGNGNIILAGGSNELFRSSDGGTSWTSTAIHDEVKCLGVDTTTHAFYAVTNPNVGTAKVYKSLDSGTTWIDSSVGLHGYLTSLVVAGADSRILYALSSSGVYRSINGGTDWSSVSNMVFSLIAVDPADSNTIYASDSFALYKSSDGGANWNLLGNFVGIGALVIDPGNRGKLYLGTWEGIYRSVNGGTNWTKASSGILPTAVISLTIDPRNSQVLYAGTLTGELFKTTSGGI